MQTLNVEEGRGVKTPEINHVFSKLLEDIKASKVASFKIYHTAEGQYVRGGEMYWLHTLTLTITYVNNSIEKHEWEEKTPSAYEGELISWFDDFSEVGQENVSDIVDDAEYYTEHYTTKKIMGWEFNLQPTKQEVEQ